MIIKNCLFFFTYLIFSFHSYGQSVTRASQAIEGNKIEISWDNDFWFSTDKYFTNGLRLNYITPTLILNKQKRSSSNKYYTSAVHIDHKIFTPSRFNRNIQNFDRPFASTLTLGYTLQKSNLLNKIIIRHGLEVGIQGRYSGGKTVQNSIHRLFPDSDLVTDWIYQLNTDPLFNYRFFLEKGLHQSDNMYVGGNIEAAAGLPQTYIQPGFILKIGRLNNPYIEHDESNPEKLKYYMFFSSSYRIKVLDTTIQGGILSRDHPFATNDLNQRIGNFSAGFKGSYKSHGLEIRFQFITPEIENGLSHTWGKLKYSYLF